MIVGGDAAFGREFLAKDGCRVSPVRCIGRWHEVEWYSHEEAELCLIGWILSGQVLAGVWSVKRVLDPIHRTFSR